MFRTHVFAILAASAILGMPAAASADTLDWQVERSFRYFRYPSDEAVHRIAFDLLKHDNVEPNPERIEKLLNGGDFWNKALPPAAERPAYWPADWKSAATPRAIIAKMRAAEGRTDATGLFESRGWASLLDTRLAASRIGTCWNSERRLHTNCREHGDYVRPEYWKIRVFAVGAPPAGKCQWTIDGGSFTRPVSRAPRLKQPQRTVAPCGEVYVYVYAGTEFDKVEGRATVSRAAPNAAPVQAAIAVHDLIVVGMGDSMTSGEGNPEFGATFSQGLASEPLYLPRRSSAGWDSAAQWTDRWCHRSVYSWQIRTMLQLAIEDRKRSITGLPYGCSGAEITEGIFYLYAGVEYVPSAKQVLGHTAQMGLAYQELCKTYQPPTYFPPVPRRERDSALKTEDFSDPVQILKDVRDHVARCRMNGAAPFKRSVDLMLLSIGINDVGFASWVKAAMLDGFAETLAGGFVPTARQDGECNADCVQTERRIARLKARYKVLRQILDERFLKDGHVSSDKVLVAYYPNGTQDTHGDTCHGNRAMTVGTFSPPFFGGNDAVHQCEGGFGFGPAATVGALMAIRKPSELNAVETFRVEGLNRLAKEFATIGDAAFTDVDAYQPRFLKRGFCASPVAGAQQDNPPCLSLKDLENVSVVDCDAHSETCIENLHISRYFKGAWRPFPPSAFRPYRPRARLFRTPNDVFMLINKRSQNVLDDSPLGPLSFQDRAASGAMHPTAEAHSIVATSAAAIARTKLPVAP